MSKKITREPYPWKKEYELDDKIFDEQTRKFLEIINLMKRLVADGIDKAGISEVFFQLAHYFEKYMLHEEIYLKELQYDKLAEHKNDHLEFTKKMIAFREGFENGAKGFENEMYLYLEKWFDEHMMIYDRRAVTFIKKKRLEA